MDTNAFACHAKSSPVQVPGTETDYQPAGAERSTAHIIFKQLTFSVRDLCSFSTTYVAISRQVRMTCSLRTRLRLANMWKLGVLWMLIKN